MTTLFMTTLVYYNGRFIKVEFTIENISDAIKSITNLKVIVSKGRVFPICAESYPYIPDVVVCLFVEIYSGETNNFVAYFDTTLDPID